MNRCVLTGASVQSVSHSFDQTFFEKFVRNISSFNVTGLGLVTPYGHPVTPYGLSVTSYGYSVTS